ncbi:MAG TPA: prepilin-type N-terminal cleavage/methylation domain-containing protein [Gemmatimonadales bacterium]|nr:prepilin-type N-terminal cleavage/methylation domain-containing protein [Gemmatimonadales bacterium]
MRARNGFTLVELLIALVLFLIVSASVFQLLHNTQRVSRAQAERTEMQSNMRAGALIVPAELRSIGYDQFVTGTGNPAGTVMSDILSMAADSIAFRAVRSSGIICNVAANTYVLDTGGFYTGYRAVAAGRDTLMVYGDMNPNRSSDDVWFRKRITAVGAGNCTAAYGGRAGTAITTDDAVPGDSIIVGAAYHSFEVMSYKLMQGADNRWYLNARSMSNPGEAYQPMLGPLAPLGFALKYYDVNGAETAVPANVRTIQVTLISQSTSRVSDMGSSNQQIQTDSVVTRVALRNAMR